jgi:Sec-independent protein translocase protein TatA
VGWIVVAVVVIVILCIVAPDAMAEIAKSLGDVFDD